MTLSEQRKQQANDLKTYLVTVSDVLGNLKQLHTDDEGLNELRARRLGDLGELRNRLEHRISRLEQGFVNIVVIGLEKQGKTTVVNSWVRREVLPTDTERCTWASTTIRHSPDKFQANIEFYDQAQMKGVIDDLLNELPLEYRESFQVPFPGLRHALNSEDSARLYKAHSHTLQELESINVAWPDIEQNLGRRLPPIERSDPGELLKEIWPYISRIDQEGKPLNTAYGVRSALVCLPLTEENVEFQISDLPGLNAPGNRAEELTWKALENSADVIVWIKNGFQNPSLDRDEENIWRKAKDADESIALTERLFVVLTHADHPKIEHGRDCHLQAKENLLKKGVPENRIFFCCARAELKELGLGGSFESTKDEIDQAKNSVSRYLNQTAPTTGIPEFRSAMVDFVKTGLSRIEREAATTLTDACKDAFRRVLELVEALQQGMDTQASASPDEIKKFEMLWKPAGDLQPGKGLCSSILTALNEQEKLLRGDDVAMRALREKLSTSIDEMAARIKENINDTLFRDEEVEIGQGGDRIIIELVGDVRRRHRRRVKEAIPALSNDFCALPFEALEQLWCAVTSSQDAHGANLGGCRT